MNRRSLLVVAGVAAISILLAVIGQRNLAPRSTTGALALPMLGAALNDVDRITIMRAGAKTVATLERRPEGWGVTERDFYPADVAKIRQALVALAEAKIVEEKTADPAFYDRLGVDAIDLETAGGTAIEIHAPTVEIPTLILGNEANSASRFARRAAEERSFLIDRNPELPRTAAQWLVADIVDVRGARVQSVTITHGSDAALRISKSNPTDTNFVVDPIPEGRELLYPGVANVIGNGLRELKLEDVSRTAAEDPDASVVTEFRTFDGLVVTLRGVELEDGAWLTFAARFDAPPAPVATAADEPDPSGTSAAPVGPEEADAINGRVAGWRYRIPAHLYEQLTRRIDDLLKAPG